MAFDLQPTLVGPRLEVRPMREADHDEMVRAASDPAIWEQHPDRERWTKEGFDRYFRSGMESGGAFAVVERATGRIVGSSRYWNLQPDREVEIGWTFLERRLWGGDHNRELKRLMIDHALRFVPRVVFLVGENNLRSRRAMEKIGGRLVGKVERKGAAGVVAWNVVFEIRREDWHSVR